MAFLGNTRPILSSHTSLPFEINGGSDGRLMIRRRETRHVISRLHCHKRELPRRHFVPMMISIPIRRSHLIPVKNNNNNQISNNNQFQLAQLVKSFLVKLAPRLHPNPISVLKSIINGAYAID